MFAVDRNCCDSAGSGQKFSVCYISVSYNVKLSLSLSCLSIVFVIQWSVFSWHGSFLDYMICSGL